MSSEEEIKVGKAYDIENDLCFDPHALYDDDSYELEVDYESGKFILQTGARVADIGDSICLSNEHALFGRVLDVDQWVCGVWEVWSTQGQLVE